MTDIAWGARVSAAFRSRVEEIAAGLGIDPSWLMACMAFETGRAFTAGVRNAAGSGAVGLIQFMPQTAAALGTDSNALAVMSAEHQLEYVADYFRGWTGRLHNVGDTYGVILWPAMVGKPDSYVLFDVNDHNHPARYFQNKGLDVNKDGQVTRGEAGSRVLAMLAEGMKPGNVWSDRP